MNFFSSIITAPMKVSTFFVMVGVALLCGIITSVVFYFQDRGGYSKSYLISLVILPAIVCAVITAVSDNIGAGIATAGAFSLVRFRSSAGKAREITGIFLSTASGVLCAAGCVGIAFVFCVGTCAVYLLLKLVPFGNDGSYDLKVTVPEDINYEGLIDDILHKYTKTCKLASVRTTDMGSLYKLQFRVILKDGIDTKKLIDEIRCRNGNLEIKLCASVEDEGL